MPALPGLLVSAAELRALRTSPGLVVVDLRWYLAGRRGADEYAAGHLPGAVFVDLDRDLSAPSGPGRHPIAAPAQFAAAMTRIGVTPATGVVVYDDAGGSIAARLWWLLRYYGHPHVAVLDGGLQAWVAAGGELTPGAPGAPAAPGVPVVDRGEFRAVATPAWVVDKSVVDALRRDPAVVLLDARAEERYAGEVEPVDARAGHIPGARSAPWSGNLAGGVFRSPADLRARYAALGVAADGGARAVCYCGSGVTACHDLLALERAGLPGARLYEGSWSDWARDTTLPAATGRDG